MIHPWGIIYGLFVLIISFNSIFLIIIRNKTAYPGNKQSDMNMGKIIILGFIFGPILFLFLKQIRTYRKHLYLKRRIRYYKMINNPFDQYTFHEDVMLPEIKKLERVYKISLIHRQAKRNKIKKKLLCR